MFRKTLLATAAAGMLAAGSLFAMTSTASAGGPSGAIQFGGPGWNVQIGNFGHGFHPQPRHCRPIVKTVKYWQWGRPHWRQVVVGYDCGRRHGPGHGHNGPGFPGGPGHGGPGHGGPGHGGPGFPGGGWPW